MWSDPRGRPLLLVSSLALLGVCALSLFILALAVLSERDDSPTPLPDADREVTPPITETLIVRVNNTAVPAPIPNQLNIGNKTFRVVPMRIQDNRWEYDADARGTAYWAPGTLVNYVIGLHASAENREVVDALRPEDLITLDTSLGTQRYRVTQQATIRDEDVALLIEQSSPRLTLVLLGEGGGQRRVVIAPFTDEGTPNQLTSVGTPINLGDARVRVLNQRLVPGTSAGLPAGMNYFQVDFEVTNIVTQVLDASQFFAELADGSNVAYPLSAKGSSAANARGFTQGALQPGQTITATAGFEVPSTMPGPSLEWRFALERGNPYIARVAIPYRPILVAPTAVPTPAPVAEVTIAGAQISPEGNELRIVGNARNLTDRFLSGSLADVSLGGPGGQLYPLNSSLPAFPWNITPGETLVFQLSFARPQTSEPVTFTLFGQSFRICEPTQPCN